MQAFSWKENILFAFGSKNFCVAMQGSEVLVLPWCLMSWVVFAPLVAFQFSCSILWCQQNKPGKRSGDALKKNKIHSERKPVVFFSKVASLSFVVKCQILWQCFSSNSGSCPENRAGFCWQKRGCQNTWTQIQKYSVLEQAIECGVTGCCPGLFLANE